MIYFPVGKAHEMTNYLRNLFILGILTTHRFLFKNRNLNLYHGAYHCKN